MLTLSISRTDIDRLNYERYYYPCPLVQKRLHALYLKSSTSYGHGEISKIVGISPNSVTTYIRLWNTGGFEAVTKVNYGTNKSVLDDYVDCLVSYFEEHPVHTIKEAVHIIEQLTGIKRSPTQVRIWLKRQGCSYRKIGQVPAKADVEEQQVFIDEELNPLIEQAQKEEIHLLFMDATHLVMGAFLSYLWSFTRVFVKSSSGRKRHNVLGAVNAIDKQIHIWTNQTYINADSIIEFLYQLRLYYYDMKPIYIVLDNARYQKAAFVRYIAFQLNIKLVFLPSYSPNLNIIERLWKWLKKKCLYAKYYESFNDFQQTINNILKIANSEFQQELEALLTLNFQTFGKKKFIS